MSEAIAQKLDEARALIEKGWCQHRLHDGHGCFCPHGAINFATSGSPRFAEYGRSVGEEYFLQRAIGDPSIADWNDAPERTQAEVIEAFKKAADLARSEA